MVGHQQEIDGIPVGNCNFWLLQIKTAKVQYLEILVLLVPF